MRHYSKVFFFLHVNMNKSPPTLLEDALSAVLHSYLCGSSLEEAMEGFYRKHSPSFQGFDFGSAEFSLLQKLAHEEYINTLEQLLGNRLSDFGCSWDRFEDVFEVSLNEEKERLHQEFFGAKEHSW